MKLLNEMIDASVSRDVPLSVVLRKLLVLSYDLKNARLTAWANAELDGYASADNVPEYRIVQSGARGTFSGPFQASIRGKSLPPSLLSKELRHWATEVRIGQNVASLEATAAAGGGKRPWPADLVLLYQSEFIQHYSLVEAWQDLPRSIFDGILDTVRNRTLRFALELRDELGTVADDIKALPPSKVEQTVTNYIFGGNVVIGDSNRFSQTGTMVVGPGDQVALTVALANLGLTSGEIAELLEAVKQDKAEEPKPGVGKRAAAFISKIGAGIGKAALSVGTDVAKVETTKALAGYLGLS